MTRKHKLSQQKPHVNEPTNKKRRFAPWNADSAGRGGPTSLEILLQWVKTSGNFKLWNAGKYKRNLALDEIVDMLAANGISHRTPPAVNSKIRILVQQYLAASVLLKNQKLPTDYLEQQIVDEEVKTQVLQLCPLHRELEPIFSRFDLSRMAPKVWTRCNDSEDSDFDEIIHVREPPPRADCSSSTRRRNTGPVRSIHEATSADELDPGETTVMVPVSTSAHDFHQEMGEQRLKSALLITRCHLQMQREKHECEMDTERCRLQTERHHGEVERKRDEMRFKMERKRFEMERKRDEMRFTMERRKLKMHLVVDTLESRKVLKDRRISNADIDAVLPLPEPMSE